MKIKPRKLTEGSTIAIISPSYPAVYLYKKRLQRAISFLERQFKVNVVFAPNAHLREGHISCSAENRAYDIHWAFLNEKIDCIMSAIGGLNSNSILPHLDFDLISRNPKVFIGYSDVTALILPIYSLSNLITFHGPALLPEWGEYPVPFDYTVKYFYQSLFNKKPLGTLKASEFWTDEFLNWDLDADNRPRRLKANSEWKSLINGSAEGVLFGGNIDTLNFLCGTRYLMPPKDDTIFFIELNGMSLAAIDRALEQLLQSGIFATTRGIIVGKFHAYDFSSSGHIKETQENHFIEIDKMILEKFSCLNVPIVSRVDCGHTDPMLTLPIGIKAKIINAEISILESAIV